MTITTCVIGLGRWGSVLYGKLQSLPEFSVVGVYDHLQQRADIDDCHRYSSLQEIIEDDNVQSCVIATPTDTHASIAKKMLKAGKNVHIAKPLALFESDCHEIRAYAESHDKILMIGHTTLFSEPVNELKNLLAGKTIHSYACRRMGVGRIQAGNNSMHDLGIHDLANILYVSGSTVSSSEQYHVAHGSCLEASSYMHGKLKSGSSYNIATSWVSASPERRTVVHADGLVIDFDEIAQKINMYKVPADYELVDVEFEAEIVDSKKFSNQDPLKTELESFASAVNGGYDPKEILDVAISAVSAIESELS